MHAYIHTYIHTSYQALSHQNLVLGYEYGSFFLSDIEPGSPSRDAAAVWLVEDGVHQVHLSPELQFGVIREVVVR